MLKKSATQERTFEAFTNILNADGYIQVSKKLAERIGLIETVLYAELLSRYKYFKEKGQLDQEGYFYNTVEDLGKATTITDPKTQSKYIRSLEKVGLIVTKLKGLPAKRHFKMVNNATLIISLLSDEKTPQSKETSEVVKIRKKSRTRTIKNPELDASKIPTNNNNIIIKNNKDDDDMPFGKEESKSLALYLDNFKETKTTGETLIHLVSTYGDDLVSEVIARMVGLKEDGGELKYPLRYLKDSLVNELEETKPMESKKKPSIKESLKKGKQLNFNNFETREMYSDEDKMKSLEYKLLGWDN